LADRIDFDAVGRGAAVTILIVIPLALVGRLVPDGSALLLPITLAIFAGFIAGGYVAGRDTSGSPAVSGTLSSLPCLILVSIAYVIIQLRSDQPVYLALMAGQYIVGTTFGMIGGWKGGQGNHHDESLIKPEDARP